MNTVMENESRIFEMLSEMLHKFDVLNETVVKLTGRVDNLTDTMELRLGKVESEIIKLNLISSENSRALLKLGDTNDRINRLERAVFK